MIIGPETVMMVILALLIRVTKKKIDAITKRSIAANHIAKATNVLVFCAVIQNVIKTLDGVMKYVWVRQHQVVIIPMRTMMSPPHL